MRFFFGACVCRPPDFACRLRPFASARCAAQGHSTSDRLVTLPRGRALNCRPAGASDNSPPFQRWVSRANDIRKPHRGGRNQAMGSVLPSGVVAFRRCVRQNRGSKSPQMAPGVIERSMKGPNMNAWLRAVLGPVNPADFNLSLSWPGLSDLLPIAILCGFCLLATAIWTLTAARYAASHHGRL